jgi:hypothetical protein
MSILALLERALDSPLALDMVPDSKPGFSGTNSSDEDLDHGALLILKSLRREASRRVFAEPRSSMPKPPHQHLAVQCVPHFGPPTIHRAPDRRTIVRLPESIPQTPNLTVRPPQASPSAQTYETRKLERIPLCQDGQPCYGLEKSVQPWIHRCGFADTLWLHQVRSCFHSFKRIHGSRTQLGSHHVQITLVLCLN